MEATRNTVSQLSEITNPKQQKQKVEDKICPCKTRIPDFKRRQKRNYRKRPLKSIFKKM